MRDIFLPIEDSKGILLTGPRIMRAQTKARPPRIIGEIDLPDEITLQRSASDFTYWRKIQSSSEHSSKYHRISTR